MFALLLENEWNKKENIPRAHHTHRNYTPASKNSHTYLTIYIPK